MLDAGSPENEKGPIPDLGFWGWGGEGCILNMEGQGGHIRETTYEHGCERGLRHGDVWGRAFLAEGTATAKVQRLD